MLDEMLWGTCIYFLGLGLLYVRECKREPAVDIVGGSMA